MQVLARFLLLIAAFAYGTMPMTGMSVMAMPVAHAMDGEALHGAISVSAVQAMGDVDCPLSGRAMALADQADGNDHASKPVKTMSHCSACLTLPAHVSLGDGGKPARAAEAGTLSPRLVSQMTAPLTPPPRA